MTDNKQEIYPLLKSTLARKFIFFILLFSSIITLIGTSLQLYLDYSKDKNNIHSTLNQIETTHLQSIANNLWVYDQEQISVQLLEILSLPDIQYIAISADGEETISVGTRESTKILSQKYPLTYSFRDKKVSLGSLQVEATLDNAFQRLRSRVVVILLTQGIKTLLVSLFILFVFYLLVGRHLIRIANYSKKLALDHLDNQLALDRSVSKNRTNDELETLVISINTMCSNLQNDIAERKKYESALLESEGKFKAMAETSPLAIYMSVGIEQKAEYVNPTFLKLFGYSLEEVPSVKQLWPLAFPDENYRKQISEEWQLRVERATENKSEIEPMEAVVTCKDGSQKTISWGFKTIGEKNWAVGLDLTERKLAERKLMASEENLHLVIEASPIGICTVDQLGDFVTTNLAYEQMVGYSKEELKGLSFFDVTHPDDRPKNIKLFQNMFSLNEKRFSMEKRYVCKDGAVIDVIVNATGIMDAEGNARFGTAFVEDITERKQTAKELEKSRKHLESLVDERTGELQNKIDELRLFNTFAVDREEQMISLKAEINSLLSELEREEKYTVVK